MSERQMWAYGLIVLLLLVAGLIAMRAAARSRSKRNQSGRIHVNLKE